MKISNVLIPGFIYTIFLFLPIVVFSQTRPMTYEEYIRHATASEKEIDVFLKESSWAQFDPDVGYILGNYSPHDGLDGSKTISTVRQDGARTSFVYANRPCRINTYGNSFTHCHQVSDAETWQEYLAGHLGEPIRNYGMGGFGVYQAYRRMLREENTEKGAEYLMLYIWGDDHIRTLLRCRYALTMSWNIEQDKKEGVGIMFHGNFWCNIEMNMKTGMLEEHESRIRTPEKLYQMTDPDWMYENLNDDLALQMYLYEKGQITDIDKKQMQQLAGYLDTEFNQSAEDMRKEIRQLLFKYAYTATKYILSKSMVFARENNKKLMVILFDPGGAMRQVLNGKPRVDQEIVDFLEENHFNYFDMNRVHGEDYKAFNLSQEEYYKRYFIGHFNPRGNHFFAFSIKPRIVEWLDPPPFTYRKSNTLPIDFKGYLEEY
jgi:hypothetical protein